MATVLNEKGKRWLAIAVAVIACVVVVLFVTAPLWKSPASPLDELGIEAPKLTEFRAASPEHTEIAALIEKKNYDDALVKVEKSLRQSDLSLKEMSGVAEDWDDESLLYEEEAEMVQNSELRWTYIYLLVRKDRNNEARKELKRYLKSPFGEHKKEAKSLLKALS